MLNFIIVYNFNFFFFWVDSIRKYREGIDEKNCNTKKIHTTLSWIHELPHRNRILNLICYERDAIVFNFIKLLLRIYYYDKIINAGSLLKTDAKLNTNESEREREKQYFCFCFFFRAEKKWLLSLRNWMRCALLLSYRMSSLFCLLFCATQQSW